MGDFVRGALGGCSIPTATSSPSEESPGADPPGYRPFVAYLFLLGAITAEVIGTSLLKATDGFTRLWPTLGVAVAYLSSFGLLSLTVRDIPVGVAYAIWSGLGTAAIMAIGAAFLGEPLSLAKVVGAGLVIAGVVVLNLGGAH